VSPVRRGQGVTHHAGPNTPFCGPPGIRTPNLRIKSLLETCRSKGWIAFELRVCVSSHPIVPHRFPFLHGDETGTRLRPALSFRSLTAWPPTVLGARTLGPPPQWTRTVPDRKRPLVNDPRALAREHATRTSLPRASTRNLGETGVRRCSRACAHHARVPRLAWDAAARHRASSRPCRSRRACRWGHRHRPIAHDPMGAISHAPLTLCGRLI
jgi:hypothetical protein